MNEIIGLENIEKLIKKDLDSQKDVLLFAFNATGKTRLSKSFQENAESSLCFNSYLEDIFIWDNDEKILKFFNNELISFIETNGLDHDIVDTFKECAGTKIEPFIDFDSHTVKFKLATGDNESNDNVKISKGEESIFKWAVYKVVVDSTLDSMIEQDGEFEYLKYIIIDDPVTSLDDYRVCTIASQIVNLLKKSREHNLRVGFLITTHHLMFFNILKNAIQYDIEFRDRKSVFYNMQRIDNEIVCAKVDKDMPLVYHLYQLKQIKREIDNNNITKNLFNILRSVLEKLSVILGYKHWNEMLKNTESLSGLEYEMFVKSLNLNSHNQYADIDSIQIPEDQKMIFKKGFELFLNKFKIEV